jgi:hypothetical protein
MNRRQLIAAIGTMSAGGAVVTGTGAFTSAEADRDVAVEVADDANAFLALDATGPNAPYTDTSNGQLGIDLTSNNATGAGGQGVNTDAITVFEGMFGVRNRGTQEIEVSITPLTFVDTDSGDILVVLIVPQTSFPSVTLTPGGAEAYSLVVDVFPGGTSPGLEIDDTMTVTGEAP